MIGSTFDGEDVVQDSLFDAYRHLETYDESRPIGPWLFRIAHNRCIDFLRRREVRAQAEDAGRLDAWRRDGGAASRTREAECAAAARAGASRAGPARGRGTAPPALRGRVNRRDWDGLRTLIAADATLRVADLFEGPLRESPYFAHYASLPVPMIATLSDVGGRPAIVLRPETAAAAGPRAFVRIVVDSGRIAHVTDYSHCPWMIEAASQYLRSAPACNPTERRLEASMKATERAQGLRNALTFNDDVLATALTDITDDLARRRLRDGGPSIAWIVGHMLDQRQR